MSEKKARIEHLSVAPQRRILVIADVHGNLPYLHGVLEKAGFTLTGEDEDFKYYRIDRPAADPPADP